LSGLIVNFWLTVNFLVGAVSGLAVLGCWRGWVRWQGRKHRRAWVEPVHAIVAPMVGIPLANPPKSWLQVEQDRSRAVFALPPGRDFTDPKDQEKIVRAASRTLGISAPDPMWALAGPEPTLTIREIPPPPDEVLLEHVQQIPFDAAPDELVIGLGRDGSLVTISLDGDSPHIGLSMGSGGGKSVTCGLILAQMLYKDCIGLVLDVKRISHSWAKNLRNVSYVRDAEDIHEALLWLQREGDKRNRIADDHADVEGKVHANVGPRIIVIAEELNTMMKRLRSYWARERGPGDPRRSPSLDALEEVMCMGRQVRINIIMIGQRLSADATGGGDSRENLAALVVARFKPATWNMLIPDLVMPPRTKHKLRGEVVTDEVKTVQIALLTGAQRRQLAVSGRIADARKWCPEMPFVGNWPPLETGKQEQVTAPSDLGIETVSPDIPGILPPAATGAEPVTLSAAVDAGILPMTLAAVRTARHRDDSFPKPVARNGLANLYDPVELDDWYKARSAL
jgi:hypothetical protein